MKKVIFILCVMVLASTNAYALNDLVRATVGKGDTIHLPRGVVNSSHSAQCTFIDDVTSITAVTIAIQGSANNKNWYTLGSHAFTGPEITAKAADIYITGAPQDTLRVYLSSLAGGDGDEDVVTCHYIGE